MSVFPKKSGVSL